MHMTLVTVAESDCCTFGMFRQFYIKISHVYPRDYLDHLLSPVEGFCLGTRFFRFCQTIS